MHGLSKGGEQIKKSRDSYVNALKGLVELASLQVRVMIILPFEAISCCILELIDLSDSFRHVG